MSTLVTGDFHLNDHPRDQYRHRAMRTIHDIAKQHKVSRIIILGDLTDEKDRHSANLVNQVVSHLARFSDICQTVILRGNHDYLDPEQPFFGFLNHLPDVVWINSPTYSPEMNALFLPHTRNYQKDWDGLDLRRRQTIFAHNTFTGAKGANGQALEGISLDALGAHKPAANKVISGDIHVPQMVGSVTYVGAPYTVDFGDDYQPRVLILGSDSYFSVRVKGPQKRLIEIRDNKLPSKCPTAGDILSVRVHLDSRARADWAKFQKEVVEWAAGCGCYLQQIRPIVDRVIRLPQPKRDTRSDEALVKDYVKSQKADNDTKAAGLNILRKT